MVWLFTWSAEQAEFSFGKLFKGLPEMWSIVRDDMLPPNTSRLVPILEALLTTLQMAFVGTVLGVLVSFPLSLLAAKRYSPHPVIYYLSRMIISFFRTVPDLVWALFFIVTVGLGPFAGVLTLAVDTTGFCGRFFAEAFEEADQRPAEALTALGANKLSVLLCSVFPLSLPSLVNSTLFSLEKAVRSSVVLGLVGAGGIGNQLKVAMDLFDYQEAATIIIAIFLLVVLVEQLSALLRRKVAA